MRNGDDDKRSTVRTNDLKETIRVFIASDINMRGMQSYLAKHFGVSRQYVQAVWKRVEREP